MSSFNKKFIAGSLFLGLSASLVVWAEQNATTPKKDDKKDPKSKVVEIEKNEVTDFQSATPYNRNSYKTLPSPFENLIIYEKNKIKKEEIEKKKREDEANLRKTIDPDGNKTTLPDDVKARELLIIQEVRKGLEVVQQLVDIRKYVEAEAKLTVLDSLLFKNSIEKMRDEVAKKREDVVAEHKDWDEINKIIESLTVDAMFVAEGKKKVALINDIAVEEGDDLNDMLGLNKESTIILTFVSANSLKIKFKKFTLQKELIDNDL